MAGFASGEGCFFVHARLSIRKVSIFFKLSQHVRDAKLMEGLVGYFGGGRYYESLNEDMCHYLCESLNVILDNVIPFFNKYPIQGDKSQNFADFVLVADLMRRKAHLTAEGYEQILLIKSRMNKKRQSE